MEEMDVFAAMVKSMNLPEFHNGMTLERYGRYHTAQIAYLEGLRNRNLIDSPDALRMLEDRWKDCAYNLRQWNLLFEYGKLNSDYIILCDCFAKFNNWE